MRTVPPVTRCLHTPFAKRGRWVHTQNTQSNAWWRKGGPIPPVADDDKVPVARNGVSVARNGISVARNGVPVARDGVFSQLTQVIRFHQQTTLQHSTL